MLRLKVSSLLSSFSSFWGQIVFLYIDRAPDERKDGEEIRNMRLEGAVERRKPELDICSLRKSLVPEIKVLVLLQAASELLQNLGTIVGR